MFERQVAMSDQHNSQTNMQATCSIPCWSAGEGHGRGRGRGRHAGPSRQLVESLTRVVAWFATGQRAFISPMVFCACMMSKTPLSYRWVSLQTLDTMLYFYESKFFFLFTYGC